MEDLAALFLFLEFDFVRKNRVSGEVQSIWRFENIA